MSKRRAVVALGALAISTAASMAGCSALDEQERRWVFQPSRVSWYGGARAAEGMQDAWIDFDSKVAKAPIKLHGLWLPQDSPDAPVLLYLHGARWDVASSAGRMRRMHGLGFAVLGIDYRGFGQSTDVLPSEAAAYEDARAAWDWLGKQHPGVPRYVFGHSLGSAIAVHLATELEPPNAASGVMLEGSFTSIPAVFGTFSWGWLPIGPFVTQRFDAVDSIGKLKAPLLVVHGSDDALIPSALGRALFDKAPEPKRFVLVDGGSHHNAGALGLEQYRQAVAELFGIGKQAVTRSTETTTPQ